MVQQGIEIREICLKRKSNVKKETEKENEKLNVYRLFKS